MPDFSAFNRGRRAVLDCLSNLAGSAAFDRPNAMDQARLAIDEYLQRGAADDAPRTIHALGGLRDRFVEVMLDSANARAIVGEIAARMFKALAAFDATLPKGLSRSRIPRGAPVTTFTSMFGDAALASYPGLPVGGSLGANQAVIPITTIFMRRPIGSCARRNFDDMKSEFMPTATSIVAQYAVLVA